MKKILKFFIWFTVLLFLLLGGAWVYIALHKKELIKSLTEKLQQSIRGEIYIGDAELSLFHQFPKLSLKLEEVHLRGPRYHEYGKDFMHLQSLFLEMDLWSLYHGKVDLGNMSLEHAEVFIFKTSSGYSNLDVFQKKDSTLAHQQDTTPGNKLLLSLKNLQLKDVQITFADSLTGKSFGVTFIHTHQQIHGIDSGFAIAMQGPVHVGGLLFKKEKGAFLENKDLNLNLHLNLHGNLLQIDSSVAALQSGVMRLKGMFLFAKPMEYQLCIETDSVEAEEGISVLVSAVQKKLNIFGAKGKVAASVLLQGKAIPGLPPAITVDFKADNLQARLLGKTAVENIAVKGRYHNHMDEQKLHTRDNSEVIIHSLRATAAGIPIQAEARVSNFADPNLNIKLHFKGSLKALNQELDTTQYRLQTGSIEGKVSYKGKLREYINNRLKKLNGQLQGEVNIAGASLLLPKKSMLLKEIRCRIHFNRETLNIPLLQAKTGNDVLSIQASLSGFIPFFTEPHAGSLLRVNIQTDHLNLRQFMAARKERKEKRNQLKTRKRLYDMLLKVEEMLATEIHLEARKLEHGRLQVENVRLDASLKNKTFKVSQANMNFAGGQISLHAGINDLPKDMSPFSLETNIDNVDVSAFMYAFNSFGSDHLTEKNIAGKITATISLQGFMDNTGSIFNEQLNGKANIRLINGKLIQFEPIIGIGDLIFMNRDFKEVAFAEVESAATLNGYTATIDRTEVSSSVIRMFVAGTHSITQGTDMQVQIPLSNLKRRPKNLKPENLGTDKKTGPSVYLRVLAQKGKKAKISYIPFPNK